MGSTTLCPQLRVQKWRAEKKTNQPFPLVVGPSILGDSVGPVRREVEWSAFCTWLAYVWKGENQLKASNLVTLIQCRTSNDKRV